MSVGSPLLSQTFGAYDMEDLSCLSEHSSMEDSSALSDFTYLDANGLPSQRVSFTPTRIKSLPRAWQRQKTTPFAARTDTQKIWKRMPLQKISSTINAGWRKETMKADGIMRPVKKMRAWGGDGSDDKENVESLAVRWDDDIFPGRSPRRKAPMEGQIPLAASPSAVTNNGLTAVSPSISFDITSNVIDPSLLEKRIFDSPAASDLQEAALGEAGTPEREEEIQRQSQPTDSNATADLLGEADNFLCVSPQTSPQSSASADMTVALPSDIQPQLSGQAESDEPPDKEALLNISALAQTSSLSILYNDPDDTSYLQDFLLRSRAQKTARVQSTIHSNSEGTTFFEPVIARAEPEPDFLMTTFQLDKPQASSETADDVDQEVNAEETDAKASSPCRRSSRLTRLPRPQKASTLLTLRRLNGGEFIALQRDAQSLAVTTRTNTRKNRNTAIPVQARLVQLKAEPSSPEKERQASKKAKSVAWSEVLARFQEFSAPPLSSSPETPDTALQVDEALKDAELVPESESKKEVKKRRKERNGSVNGTPAPKRSIEILLEQAAHTTGGLDSKHTGKRTRSKTKS